MDQLKTNILSKACKYGHLEVVKELIKHNAPIDKYAINGAAYYGHLEVVKELIKHNASIIVWVIYWAETKEIKDLLTDYMNKRGVV